MRLRSAMRLGPYPIRHPWCAMSAHSHTVGSRASSARSARNPADGLAVVLAEVGYGFEVRHQASGQPNQFNVALALPLQTPARLHPIEVSVDVNLQQGRRVIGWPSCCL